MCQPQTIWYGNILIYISVWQCLNLVDTNVIDNVTDGADVPPLLQNWLKILQKYCSKTYDQECMKYIRENIIFCRLLDCSLYDEFGVNRNTLFL